MTAGQHTELLDSTEVQTPAASHHRPSKSYIWRTPGISDPQLAGEAIMLTQIHVSVSRHTFKATRSPILPLPVDFLLQVLANILREDRAEMHSQDLLS